MQSATKNDHKICVLDTKISQEVILWSIIKFLSLISAKVILPEGKVTPWLSPPFTIRFFGGMIFLGHRDR